MRQAQGYASKIREGYLQNRGDMTVYIDSMTSHLQKLETRRIGTYSELVAQVATREQCLAFLQQTGFDFDQLIQTLNYLLRWVLPFKTPLGEFIDADKDAEVSYLAALKKHKIGSNLDLLEAGRAETGRVQGSQVLLKYPPRLSPPWCIRWTFRAWRMCVVKQSGISAEVVTTRWKKSPMPMVQRWKRRWKRITEHSARASPISKP